MTPPRKQLRAMVGVGISLLRLPGLSGRRLTSSSFPASCDKNQVRTAAITADGAAAIHGREANLHCKQFLVSARQVKGHHQNRMPSVQADLALLIDLLPTQLAQALAVQSD
eukprot:2754791-Rhodomonas_salina.3